MKRAVTSHGADLAVSLAAGALLALPAWSDVFFWTPYIGLAPWIYLYGLRERRPSWLVYLAGVAVFWIAYHQFLFGYGVWVPFACAAIFTPVYLIFPVALRRLRRLRAPLAIIAPIAWVATEFAVTKLSLAGVALALLGYSQARVLSLIQIADLGGVFVVSALIAFVNGAIIDALRGRPVTTRPGVVVGGRRRALAASAAAVLALLAANLYGLWRMRALETEPGPRIGVVQPAMSHTGENLFGAYGPAFFLTAQAWREPGDVDLIVWPESTIQGLLDRYGIFGPDLAWLATRAGAPLLVGAGGSHPRYPAAPTNSVYLVGDDGRPVGRHDKIRLVPWAEYVPFQGVLGGIDRDLPKYYTRFVADVLGSPTYGKPESRGDGVTIFRHRDLPWFSALICFETMDPVLSRAAARGGARFLVNPTSEGIAGAVLQLQMLRISALRAVETRLPMVRAGNQGISAFIGPRGELQSVLRGMHTGAHTSEPGIATERIELARATSLYVRSGDLFAIANISLLFGGFLWGFARRR